MKIEFFWEIPTSKRFGAEVSFKENYFAFLKLYIFFYSAKTFGLALKIEKNFKLEKSSRKIIALGRIFRMGKVLIKKFFF